VSYPFEQSTLRLTTLHIAANNGVEEGNDKENSILCAMHFSAVTVKKIRNVTLINACIRIDALDISVRCTCFRGYVIKQDHIVKTLPLLMRKSAYYINKRYKSTQKRKM